VRLVDRSPDLAPEGLSERQHQMWERMMATSDLRVYAAEIARDVVATTSLLVMPHVTYDCRPTAFIESM
jgi:hypothetical protein